MSGAPGTAAGGQPLNAQSLAPILQQFMPQSNAVPHPMGANPLNPQIQPSGGNFPPSVPARNPPMGGIAGNPGYSVAQPPQLNGNYWNQVAQQLAGPTYQARGTAASGSMPTASTPSLGSYPISQGQGRPLLNIGSGISGRRAYNV